MNDQTNSKNGGQKGRQGQTQRDKACKIYNDTKTKIGLDSPDFRQTVLKNIESKLGVAAPTASVYYYHAKEQAGDQDVATPRARRASSAEGGSATNTQRKGRKAADAGAAVAASRGGMPKLHAAVRDDEIAFFLTADDATKYANRRPGTEVRKARKSDFAAA